MFVLCMALAGPGLASVVNTTKSVRKVNRDVNDLTTQGLVIMDSLERVKRNIDGLDLLSILRNGEACPNWKYLSKFLSISSIQGIDEDFDHLKEQMQKIDSEGIRQAINFIMDGTEHIGTAVTNIEENDWIVRMFLLGLSLMTCFMIFAACYEWSGRCHCLSALAFMLEFFILPTFVLAIICCWIATSALAFASISNAGKA